MQKSLIIGLGGTGTEICKQMAEKIKWEVGDLNKVSFIKFFCIDTSKDMVNGSQLDNDNDFFHITIDDNTIRNMAKNPGAYKNIELDKWIDPEVFRVKNLTDTGTSGVRMFGRVAFLYSVNFKTIYDRIKDKLDELTKLTEQKAREDFGEKGDKLKFTDRKIRVYVIATSCGGTGSGTFIDIGYLLQHFKNKIFNNIEIEGLLTLPSRGETQERKKINSYVLLTELNHFSTKHNEYFVKYENMPEKVEMYDCPYRLIYLLSTDRAKTGVEDVCQLNYTISQYIYANTFFDIGVSRDGRINDILGEASIPDKLGYPLNFMTFGISLIQYPNDRVIKGCTYKLLTRALEEYLKDQSNKIKSDEIFRSLGFDEDKIYKKLITYSGSISLEERIAEILGELMDDYSSISDIKDLKKDLNKGFEIVDNTTEGKFSPGIVHRTINYNFKKALDDYKNNLNQYIKSALFDIERGPTYCRKFLKELNTKLTGLINRNPSKPDEGDMDKHIDYLKDAEDTLLWVFRLRRKVEDNYLSEFIDSARIYYRDKLKEAALPREADLYKQLQEWLNRLLTRIENFELYLEIMKKRYSSMWEEQDKPININGILLFKDGSRDKDELVRQSSTIDQRYRSCYENKYRESNEQERKLISDLISRLEFITKTDDKDDIFIEPSRGLSYYETENFKKDLKSVRVRSIDDVKIIDSAKKNFIDDTDDVISSFNLKENEKKLKDCIEELSDIFLNLNLGDPNYEDTDRKHLKWAFYKGADLREINPNSNLASFKNIINKYPGIRTESLNDPYTVIFCCDRGSFPLRIINGLDDWRKLYDNWMKNASDFYWPFARKDITFISLNSYDRDDFYKAEEFLLICIALEIIKRQTIEGNVLFILSGDTSPIYFEPDIKKSTIKVYTDLNLKKSLINEIHKWLANCDDLDIFINKLFKEFENKVKPLGLAVQGIPDEEKWSYIRQVFVRYTTRKGNERILKVYKRIFPPQNDFNFLYHSANEEPCYPDTGYYCSKCGCFYGEEQSSVPSICLNLSCREINFL